MLTVTPTTYPVASDPSSPYRPRHVSNDPTEKQPPIRDDAKTAGRGFLVITAAKLWFMVGGALITFGLPYIFARYGDGRALYGQYYDLNNILSIFSMVMVSGVMQSIAKFVAARPDQAGGVVRQMRTMMLVLGTLIGGGFMVAAPTIALSRGNPDLVLGYRAAGLILFCYGIYTVYIGTLNGRKLFFRQALYDFGFTTLKATLVLGMALAGFGVIGAFSGFAAAAVIIMCLAIWRVGPSLGEGPREPSLYAFAAKVIVYTVVFNLIFKLDGVLIKPALMEFLAEDMGWLPGVQSLGEWMSSAGELAGQMQNQSDRLMADYGMAVALSRMPWQATIAITFVVFPMVSAATFQNDRARTQLYIRQTMRYTMLLVGAAAVVLMAVPQAVFGVLPADYAGGAEPLVWLAPAYFFFSMFNVINTLLISADRAGSALVIGVATLALAAALYLTIMTDASSAEGLLTRAGACTLIAFAVGTALGLGALWREYGAPMPAMSVVRVGLVGAALFVAGRMAPPLGKIGSIGLAVGIGLAYVIALFIIREFDAEDRARFGKIIRRGRK